MLGMAEVPVRHPEATPSPSTGEEASELQLLLDMVKALEEEEYEILQKARENDERKAEIMKKIEGIRLKDIDTKIPDRIIMAFVEALVKANRYFDLKQYLRERFKVDNYQHDLYLITCDKIEEEDPFGNDEYAVTLAVQVVRGELSVEWKRRQRAEYKKRFNLNTSQNLTSEEKEELFVQMYPRYGINDLEVTDEYARSTPILDLVYQIREEDYVMDKKPEEELQKIKKSHPWFYNDYFIHPKEPMDPMEYSDDTVAVKNVPFDACTHEVKAALKNCGEVISIHSERGKNSQTGKKCKIVFVTFKDSAAAKRALVKESVLIDGSPAEITTPQSASAWLKKEERTISSFESALETYNELRSKYQKQCASGVGDIK